MKNKEKIIKKLKSVIKELNETAPINLTPASLIGDLEDVLFLIDSKEAKKYSPKY